MGVEEKEELEGDGGEGCSDGGSEGDGDGGEGGGKTPIIRKKGRQGKAVQIISVTEYPPEYQQPFVTEDIPSLQVRTPSLNGNSKWEKEQNDKSSVVMRKFSEEEEELLKSSEKKGKAGEITAAAEDDDDFDDDPDQTVDWLADKDDFQRPAKLDLIVGFLRLLCFLSVCTSVFGVVISVLFPIQQTENLKLKVLDVFVFLEGDIYEKFNYTKTVRALNPYYPKRDMIFTLRCTAGMIQLTYLIVNAITVTIDAIATNTFRSVPSHDDHHHCHPHQRHREGGKSMVS